MERKLTGLKIDKASQPLNSDKIRPILDFLNEHYEIRINCFDSSHSTIHSKKKQYRYPPTFDDISLHLHASGIVHNDTLLRKILKSQNEIESYNPIGEYFKKIEGSYKGKSHIDMLTSHLVARDFGDKPQKYYQDRLANLVKKWLVATTACSLGKYANPVALGLIHSEEGIGKTYFFDFILPPELKDLYVEFLPDKMEIQEVFARKMIVLFDELLGISNRTAELFKNVIQRDCFDLRSPRDPYPTPMPRVASACFTSNMTFEKGGFLTPRLGTRRFGCIELEDINHSYSTLIDINQLWAETMVLLNGGYNYIFDMADFREFKEYNMRYMNESMAAKIVKMYFDVPVNGEGEWKQPSEILHDLVKKRRIGKNDGVNAEHIGIAFTELNFPKKMIRIPGKGPRYAYNIINV